MTPALDSRYKTYTDARASFQGFTVCLSAKAIVHSKARERNSPYLNDKTKVSLKFKASGRKVGIRTTSRVEK